MRFFIGATISVLIACSHFVTSASSQSLGEIPSPEDLGLGYLIDEPSREDLFEVMKSYENTIRPNDFVQQFALLGRFRFPNDTTYDVVNSQARVPSIFGIDISHHNGPNVPLEALKEYNVSFVFMKASQGSKFRDKRFAENWNRLDPASAARVHRGAYHFLSASPASDAKSQAIAFLSVIKQQGGLQATDMPPVLDVEWDKECGACPDRWQGQSREQIIDKVLIWLQTVESALGRKPIIYTARSWMHPALGLDGVGKLKDYQFWTADYSKSSRAVESPNTVKGSKHVLWQFTDAAELSSGFDGRLDANIFYGNEAAFVAEFGVEAFPQ